MKSKTPKLEPSKNIPPLSPMQQKGVEFISEIYAQNLELKKQISALQSDIETISRFMEHIALLLAMAVGKLDNPQRVDAMEELIQEILEVYEKNINYYRFFEDELWERLSVIVHQAFPENVQSEADSVFADKSFCLFLGL